MAALSDSPMGQPLCSYIRDIGRQDIRECLRAHRRDKGEYLVFWGGDYQAEILMYRWRP